MNQFAFDLGDEVELVLSGENGIVIGRAEYSEDTPSYLVRYKAADGRQTQCWWSAQSMTKKDV